MSEFVDAMALAARDGEITQRFRIAELPRLRELAVEDDSKASLHAQFHAVVGRCGIAGKVTATVRAVCQRCLKPVDLDIDDRFHVMVVASEKEMSLLSESQDSVIADAEHLDLGWLTEEQLLLAMPLVPLHANEDECRPRAEPTSYADSERQTPFAQLRELMKKQ
jgi:uncharacterized protein